MKIDFSTVLKDPDDMDKDAMDQHGKLVTLGKIARHALVSETQDDRRDGEAKYRAYKLSDRIRAATKPLDLKADQITLIKQRIGKIQPASVSGQCWDMLDPPPVEDEPEVEKAA